MSNSLSPLQLLSHVKNLPKGARFEYHRGYLPTDKTGPVVRLSLAVLKMEEEGVIILTQRKLGFHNYSYTLQRSIFNTKVISREVELYMQKLEHRSKESD